MQRNRQKSFILACLKLPTWLVRKKYPLDEVYTPTIAARLTYVERGELSTDLRHALGIPGMQIVMYGYSGCGKTTLIQNELARQQKTYISTNCTSSSTIDQIVLNAFDKLEPFFTSQKSLAKTSSISASISSKYLSLVGALSVDKTLTEQRALPLQLTPQRLAEFLGAAECIWVIEDFHKVAFEQKKQLAQILKTFVDTANYYPKTKIVCIGRSWHG